MQIQSYGFIPKRKIFSEVVNPPSALKPCRVRLTRPCVVWQGLLGEKNSVYEFDLATPEGHEAVAMLTSHSTSGVKVPLSTPLHTASAPVAPPPLPKPEPTPTLAELTRALASALKASKA